VDVHDKKQPVPINVKNGFWNALGSALGMQYGWVFLLVAEQGSCCVWGWMEEMQHGCSCWLQNRAVVVCGDDGCVFLLVTEQGSCCYGEGGSRRTLWCLQCDVDAFWLFGTYK
jgi:hypothetical protein